MAERLISKRVKFPKGKQKIFLVKSGRVLNFSHGELAKLLKISTRTLSDWKREKINISLLAVKKLCTKTGQKFPRKAEILDPFWYTTRGAKKGGLTVYHKYGVVGGNPEKRKQKWFEWWNKKGKFNKNPILNNPLPIKKPRRSEKLAEFVGIVLGDGGISKRQITITLHCRDDKEFSKFVIKMTKKLFGVNPGVYRNTKDSVNDIVVSRTELVNFCTKKLGLKTGNKVKQQVDIPRWIKTNKKFQIACVRGLIDTDGSVFNHCYKVNGKTYCYKKLSFTSLSKPLAFSVYNILSEMGLKPRIFRRKDVCLDSRESMRKYFQLIGSHNPKHLNRYRV
jgi:hypothetical protein